MSMKKFMAASVVGTVLGLCGQANAATIIFQDDFNSPAGFVNGAGSGYTDVSQQQVNDLYGSTFAQAFTVETIQINPSQLYSDPSGTGGDYALGMLSTIQDDRLWLTFDVGALAYVNISLDVSSIGLQGPGGPFTTNASVPEFELKLFDDVTNAELSSATFSGTASDIYTFDWTDHLLALSTAGNTTGMVRMQLDLLDGGYAAFDNLVIASSDEEGDITPTEIPAPAMLGLFGLGLTGLGFAARRRNKRTA